jgi:hypothetical protein
MCFITMAGVTYSGARMTAGSAPIAANTKSTSGLSASTAG